MKVRDGAGRKEDERRWRKDEDKRMLKIKAEKKEKHIMRNTIK